MTVGKGPGLLHTQAQFAGSIGMQMMQQPLQRGKLYSLGTKEPGLHPPLHTSASADSQRVTEQPQFSPFTPILLHLTARTTGSDTDEFAKSKENNWMQQQNKGWVFRGLLEGTGRGGKLRRREKETLP